MEKNLLKLYDAPRDCELEFLVALDDDDPELENYSEIDLRIHYTEGLRYGYEELYKYFNELAELAKGDWLWVWDDDCELDDNWYDAFFNEPRPEYCVMGFNQYLTPLVSRAFYDRLGHLAYSPHVDSWLFDVASRAGCFIALPDMNFHHPSVGSPHYPYHHGEMQDLVNKDAEAIRKTIDFFTIPN